jgi:Txe/YoeB family toxin of toxin-antitoxin system
MHRLDRLITMPYVITYERKWLMTTLTATEARKSLYGLFDDVAASHMSVQITGKRNSAVLVSMDDWQAIQETLFLTIDSRNEGVHSVGDEDSSRQMRQGAEMVNWTLVFTKLAQKDAKKLRASGLKPQAERLLAILEKDPFQKPPPYENLVGDLSGAYSRRINIQHRLCIRCWLTLRPSRSSGSDTL